MDRDKVEVHKNANKERGQYPAILIQQARLVKDLSYSKKISGICLSSFRLALLAYLDDDLERLQRRALRISFTLPCLMLKPSAHQDYLHYLKEENKSPRNSSSRSLQTRDTNYILFCHANPGNSPLDPKQCSTIKERFNSKQTTQYEHIWILIQVCFVDQQKVDPLIS